MCAASAIQAPSVQQLREAARRRGLTVADDQLQQYSELIAEFVPSYSLTDSLPEPVLPVKYPRTPGYRPPPDENTHNAWYWKTDLRGASSGPLLGKRLAMKDNIAVAGVPMMNGSRALEGYVPEYDATVVTRVLDAGGVIVGKAVCEDLCFSASGHTTAKGQCLNPVDAARSPGGSSNGCAVLVALGEVDMAIGGDQGGSVRIPSSWCGTVGLKPTHGLVPYSGACTIEPMIDHLGPMARTVSDVALLLEVLAGADGHDHRQPDTIEVPKYSQTLGPPGSMAGKRVGLLKEGFDQSEAEVCAVVRAAAAKFTALGATVEEVSVPQHIDAFKLWTCLAFDGGYQNMILGSGSGVGWRGQYPTSMSEHLRRGLRTVQDDLSMSLKLMMLMGDYIDHNYGQKFYHKAANIQPVIKKAYDEALEKFDVLLMPTMTKVAPKVPEGNPSVTELYKYMMYGVEENTGPFDYTGHPALSLPAGLTPHDGLPVGVQLVGRAWGEVELLQAAYALEQALKAGEGD